MLPSDGLRQSCDATSLGGYSVEIIRAVQAGEAVHGAAGDPERTLREFVTQPTGIGRRVAVRPEFQPPVSSTGELIEKAFPRRLPPFVTLELRHLGWERSQCPCRTPGIVIGLLHL